MKGTKSNVEFLLQIQKTTTGGDAPSGSGSANKENSEA
jgi:transcription termination factor Rho